ncbi:MAG: FtsX-like permease family protein, partial [Bryobacteraceae bacterium]
RMALGASRGDVLRAVVREGLAAALTGVGIGLAASLWLTRLLTRFLYGVKPADAATFTSVALSLIAVACLACYVPARRAMRVDPLVALRYQ